MQKRVRMFGRHLLRAATLLELSACADAGAHDDVEPPSHGGSSGGALAQQVATPIPAIKVSAVSAVGGGCKDGAMNVFTGSEYVHFFLTDLRLQSKEPPVALQTVGCAIKARIKGERGQSFKLKRLVTRGSMFLEAGSVGAYSPEVVFSGARGFTARTKDVRGPFFDVLQDAYEVKDIASKCGEEVSLDLQLAMSLSGTSFGVIEVSDLILAFERQACSP